MLLILLQMTLYVPGPVLRNSNYMMVVEFEAAPPNCQYKQCYVNFIDHPILNITRKITHKNVYKARRMKF